MHPSRPTPSELDPAVELAASRWVARRDAGLSPEETVAFERWLASDPRHRTAFSRHEQTWTLFDCPSSEQADVLAQALAVARNTRRWRNAAASTALAVCVVATSIWLQRPGRDADAKAPLALLAADGAVVVRPEERVLPDGSMVELKPGALLTVEFSERVRRVSLQKGEAHFRVKRDPARPFVVAAAGIDVQAVGTAFSVDLQQTTIAILVTEGRVAVDRISSHPPTTEHSLVLSPSPEYGLVAAGHRLVVERDPAASPQAATPIQRAEMAASLSWRVPRLEFTDTPLATAVALFNRHGQDSPRLVVDPRDAQLGRLEISGYFRSDNAEAFLHLIEQTLGIKADREGATITLRRTRE